MFENELILQEKFVELKRKELKENEKILSEFNARFGNVDIIQALLSDTHLMSQEQAYLLSTYQYAKVLAYLHKKAIRTYNYLKNQTDYDHKTLKYIISRLIKENIIIEISSDRYIISPEFQFPTLQFTSYEAKLIKWKKAILQASINKKFSSFSYAVFPIDVAIKLQKDKLKYFQTYNIGLIGVSLNKLEYLYNPRKELVKLKVNPSLISSIAKFQIETSTFSNSVSII